ncbi:hypothetical protein Cob_v003488 [Colletotrichum orbiculare MAFF 240422]|uniref:Uncharacterized protein n=1 Tax=Colletotrichum orbiculare (strain 104-T / ATCC 96160 / CBS 514.97 / LARS 414 / MAFF 240422) TaxID=1213857 RepID=A0A484G3X5_COLOR|nr:hypothetical protein Cob_v003488 [Colletotrichum orbiculare MAFF 240422]
MDSRGRIRRRWRRTTRLGDEWADRSWVVRSRGRDNNWNHNKVGGKTTVVSMAVDEAEYNVVVYSEGSISWLYLQSVVVDGIY